MAKQVGKTMKLNRRPKRPKPKASSPASDPSSAIRESEFFRRATQLQADAVRAKKKKAPSTPRKREKLHTYTSKDPKTGRKTTRYSNKPGAKKGERKR